MVGGKVGSRWINHLIAFARNSPPPLSSYNSTASLLHDALADDLSFPPVWEEWRILTEIFGMGAKLSLTKLLPVAHRCTLEGWFHPFEFSALSFNEIKTLARVLPDPAIALDLWKAAVLAYASEDEGTELSPRGVSHDAEAIITRAHAAALQASSTTLDVARAALTAPGPSDFLHMGPSDRLKAFKTGNAPRDSVLAFFQAGRKINASKSIRFSLPCFSSALR